MRWQPCVVVLVLAGVAAGDEFERLEGRALADVPRNPDATAHESLTVEELALLPRVFRDTRASLLVAVTGQGNPARLLVAPAFRSPPPGGGEPAPILVVERLDTFEAGPATSILTRRSDLVLFDGFRLDLDTGQVVPDGQGGDLQFLGGAGPGDQKLVALDGARLYTLKSSPLPDRPGPGRPSAGRGVAPGDFAGRFRLVANGQWTGALELEVGEGGVLTGRFRSDQTGSSYRVSGQVGGEAPNRIRFAVAFPRSRQEYEGHLFTEGKDAIAGTTTLLERSYGFFAVREGGEPAPGGVAIEGGDDRPGALIVAIDADGGLSFEGRVLEAEALLDRLRAGLRQAPGAAVRVLARPEVPYRLVADLLDRLREAGIEDIRLGVDPRD